MAENIVDKIIQEKGYVRLQKMFRIVEVPDKPGSKYDPAGMVILSTQIPHHFVDLPSINKIMEIHAGESVFLGTKQKGDHSHLILVTRLK